MTDYILISGYYLVNGIKGNFIKTNDRIKRVDLQNKINEYRKRHDSKRKEKNGKLIHDPDVMPCYGEAEEIEPPKPVEQREVFEPTKKTIKELIRITR